MVHTGNIEKDARYTREEVDRVVDRYLATTAQPGLVFGIVRDGRLEVSGQRGVRQEASRTAFRIASMTKSFTAATILLLRDEGALRLDDEVARYVPEAAALRPPTDDAPPLTLRSLLTMTGGLPTDDPWGDRQQDLPEEDFAELLRTGLSFAWTPGTAYEYSNTGYALLGAAITAVTGQPYHEVVTARLLRPLGMTSTVFTADEVPPERLARGYRPGADGGWEEVPFAGHGAYASMGGLFSTLEDLAVWVGGFTDAYPPRSGPDTAHPLRRADRREMQQPHRGLAPQVTWHSLAEPPVIRGAAYGFGLVVEHDPVIGDVVGHGGGYPGFGTHMCWHPASGVGAVALANATYAPASRLTAALLALALSRDLSPAGRSPADRSPAGHAPAGHAPAGHASARHGGTGERPRSTARPRAIGAPAPVPWTREEEEMAGATAGARREVERLVAAWDDERAATLFAANVDQDEPLERRREAIEHWQSALGPLTAQDGPGWSLSPAHAGWWFVGPGGRVRAEILMNPARPPRVQTLSLVAVPHPPDAVRELAAQVAAGLAAPEPVWPSAWSLPVDREDEILRAIRVAAAWAGPCRVVEVTAGDGVTYASFRLEGWITLVLRLSWQAGTRALTSVVLEPV